jgi:hypothetical protein
VSGNEFLIKLFAGPLVLLIASLPKRAAHWATRREPLELELARLDEIHPMDPDEIERERSIALRKSKKALAAAGQATSGCRCPCSRNHQ